MNNVKCEKGGNISSLEIICMWKKSTQKVKLFLSYWIVSVFIIVQI